MLGLSFFLAKLLPMSKKSKTPPKPIIYCYVDETGADFNSRFFLVGVVVVGENRAALVEAISKIEAETKRIKRKWTKSNDAQRADYMRRILRLAELHGRLFYMQHDLAGVRVSSYALTVARALIAHSDPAKYKAVIFLDGLQENQVKQVGVMIRTLDITTEKVKNARSEESSELMRLADALCGFVRDALEDKAPFNEMLKQAKQNGFIREV